MTRTVTVGCDSVIIFPLCYFFFFIPLKKLEQRKTRLACTHTPTHHHVAHQAAVSSVFAPTPSSWRTSTMPANLQEGKRSQACRPPTFTYFELFSPAEQCEKGHRAYSVGPRLFCALMDLLNSYDDDDSAPVASTGSFLPVRAVNAGWVYLICAHRCTRAYAGRFFSFCLRFLFPTHQCFSQLPPLRART